MQCKLYESLNGGHILKFSKKCGYLEDYYNKLKIIISLVKNERNSLNLTYLLKKYILSNLK